MDVCLGHSHWGESDTSVPSDLHLDTGFTSVKNVRRKDSSLAHDVDTVFFGALSRHLPGFMGNHDVINSLLAIYP